jgi:DNA-binding protein
MSSIVLRAMGKTITKAVSIAEILKKRFPIHQVTEIGSTEIEEIYHPSVEGLDEYVLTICDSSSFPHR